MFHSKAIPLRSIYSFLFQQVKLLEPYYVERIMPLPKCPCLNSQNPLQSVTIYVVITSECYNKNAID